MADVAGQPRPDLTAGQAAPESMGFFELLKRLETGTHRFGRTGGAGDEPARLGQRARLAVATRDVASFRPATDTRPAEVDVEVLGLIGPEGALPLHLTRWIMARLSDRWFAGMNDRETSDTAFLDFCNMLQHRLLALYWRAWADGRAEVQTELGTGGRVQSFLATLGGIGFPGTAGLADAGIDRLKLRHGTSLAQEVQGVERLTRLVGDAVGAPVAIAEFVGEWMPIPARLQSRLGTSYATLGRDAVAGARSFQRQLRAELAVGPVGLDQYARLSEDRTALDRIVHCLRFAAGCELTFDLRLVLSAAEVPEPRLGRVRLGRTAWLPEPGRGNADDYLRRAICGTAGRDAA